MVEIDAKGAYYRDLNKKVREAVEKGEKETVLKNVNGQYYIGDGLRGKSTIVVEGVPGNDLAAFMDGPTIRIKANAQDNIGNTMNSGKVIVEFISRIGLPPGTTRFTFTTRCRSGYADGPPKKRIKNQQRH